MKAISILGCTGSIGTNTLAVIRAFPNRFRVVGLAAGNDAKGLAAQVAKFRPRVVSVATAEAMKTLASLVDLSTGEILWFNRLVRGSGDLREAEKAKESLGALLDSFPG